jgi:hypothetical protein
METKKFMPYSYQYGVLYVLAACLFSITVNILVGCDCCRPWRQGVRRYGQAEYELLIIYAMLRANRDPALPVRPRNEKRRPG